MKSAILPGQLTAGNFQWTTWLRFALGGILAFNGFADLIGLLAKSRLLDMPDPLLGIPFWNVSLTVAAAQLLVAALCLFTNRRTLSLWLAAWLAVNFLMYRIGLWTMGWHHPYGWLQGLMNSLNISPVRADVVSFGTTGLLLFGSLTLLWYSRRVANGESLKMACPACGGKIKYSTHNAGQNLPCQHCQTLITLGNPPPVAPQPVRDGRSPEAMVRTLKIACTKCGGHIEFSTNSFGQKIPCPHCQAVIILQKSATLKMSCAACDGHITFPAHALGEQIPCPHCNREITLKEPT